MLHACTRVSMTISQPRCVVLLGDSVFDNAAYVPHGKTVESQLRDQLPDSVELNCLAEDGATTSDLGHQLRKVPRGASHLVVSIGGNDILLMADLLLAPASSVSDALELFSHATQEFGRVYRKAIAPCIDFGARVTVCTIYSGSQPNAQIQRAASAAMVHFNDAILQAAMDLRVSVLDIRSVCSQPEDFTNVIEPSILGAAKIAAALKRLVDGQDGCSSMTGRIWQ